MQRQRVFGHNPSQQSSEETAAAPARQPQLRPAAIPGGGGSTPIICIDAGARPCRAKAGDLPPRHAARLQLRHTELLRPRYKPSEGGRARGALSIPSSLTIPRGSPDQIGLARPGPGQPNPSCPVPPPPPLPVARLGSLQTATAQPEPAGRRAPAGALARGQRRGQAEPQLPLTGCSPTRGKALTDRQRARAGRTAPRTTGRAGAERSPRCSPPPLAGAHAGRAPSPVQRSGGAPARPRDGGAVDRQGGSGTAQRLGEREGLRLLQELRGAAARSPSGASMPWRGDRVRVAGCHERGGSAGSARVPSEGARGAGCSRRSHRRHLFILL